MKDDLCSLFDEYKNCTMELIKCLNEDNIDGMDAFIAERQSIINKIQENGYSKEELKNTAGKENIMELEKKLQEAANAKKEEINDKQRNLTTSRNAAQTYNSRLFGKSMIFSKKV